MHILYYKHYSGLVELKSGHVLCDQTMYTK